jgi:excisionase family DNA binding protein
MPEDNKPTPRFLTIEQAATELNIGQPLIRALLKNGELRGFQLGGRGTSGASGPMIFRTTSTMHTGRQQNGLRLANLMRRQQKEPDDTSWSMTRHLPQIQPHPCRRQQQRCS